MPIQRKPFQPKPQVIYLGAPAGVAMNKLFVNELTVAGQNTSKSATFNDVTLRRIIATKSLPLTAANFDVSQLGPGASVTVLAGSNGVRGQFAATFGSAPVTNPNIIITVDDTPSLAQLFGLFVRNGGNSALPHTWTTVGNTYTITLSGVTTPAEVVEFSFVVLG